MNLILFGLKHCGKTYFGKKLSLRLNCPFIDTDALIEEKQGISCREFYKQFGKSAFRAAETQILTTLNPGGNSVIAVGGGMMLNPNHVDFLQKLGALVYLILDVETLKERTFSGDFPTTLDSFDKKNSFEQMYTERTKIYETIDAIPLLLSGKTDEMVLEKLTTLIQKGFHGQ